MKTRKSIASILVFVGSLLCFFLPFVSISCAGQKFFSITGQELATGSSVSVPQPFGSPKTQKIDPDPFASLAAVCALVGLAFSFAGRRMAVGTTTSSALAAIFLIILRSHMSDQLEKQGEGMLQANYEIGYTLALLLLLIAAAMNGYIFAQNRRSVRDLSTTAVVTPGSTDG